MESIKNIASYILIVFCVINAILYLSKFKYNNKAFKYFAIYLGLIAVIQLSATFIGRFLGQHNLFLFHFYFILQFIFLSIFYRYLLKKIWIYKVLILVLLILAYQYFETPSIFFIYNAFGVALTQGILVIYALIYFYNIIKGDTEFLLVNIGLFFYLLSSILIFASGNLIFDLKEVFQFGYRLLMDLNDVLYFGLQILIFVEWLKNYSQVKIK